MSESLTKNDLNQALTRFGATINDRIDSLESRINNRFDAVDKRFDEIDKRFDGVDKRFIGIESRLELLEDDMSKVKHAILDYFGTDRALRNLVQQLKTHGIALEDSKIFAL